MAGNNAIILGNDERLQNTAFFNIASELLNCRVVGADWSID
jgi:hypothetical protein